MTNGNISFDIAQVLGRIANAEGARRLFEERLDADTLAKIRQLTTPTPLILRQ